MTALIGVGGVGQEQADALVGGDGTDAGQVGEAAVDGREIELEIAGVEDDSLRRVERRGHAMGNRVGHGDELDVERSDLTALAIGHRDELGATEEARLLDAIAGETQGEGRTEDGEREFAQQVRQTTDVVLVTMGGDAAHDAIGVLAQVGEVGQHEVDAQHVEVGEHEPAVDEHDRAVDLDARAVAADLSESSEEGDADRVLLSCRAHAYSLSCTASARASRSSGPKPMGGRHGPAGCPSARNIALVGTGLGLRSPVSKA